MGKSLAFAIAGAFLLVRGAAAAGQESAVPPTYTNVEIVSVDPSTRVVVIKNSKGSNETFDLDDGVAGAAGVKAGDRVILTVRGEPGRKRISAITKTVAAATGTPASSAPALVTVDVDRARVEVREHFGNQVASLSQQARGIDGVWTSFVKTCDVKQSSKVEGGRDWFGLWDGRVRADLSSGFCRDLFNQIVTSGEGIKKAMAAAEDVARQSLAAGDIREICKLHSMDWEGWDLPAPEKLEL
jgi:hypothetical protein